MRNKYFIKTLAIIALISFLGLCVLSMLPIRSNAASDQQKINNAQQQQESAKQKKAAAEDWKENEEAKKEKIDSQISAVQTKINAYQAQINEKTAAINKSQAEIDALTADLQKQNAAYNSRAKMLIQKGDVPYLEILLKAKSVDDLLTRVTVVKQVAKYDSQKLAEIKDSMAQVEKMKNELLAKKAEVVSLKQQQDSQKQELNQYSAESQKIISNLESNIAEYEKQYDAAKKAEEQARADAEAKRKQAEAAAAAAAAKKSSGGGAASSGATATAPAQFVGGQFLWPSQSSYTVTSPYGYRIHPVTHKSRFHSGVDIGAGYGTNVLAANSGTVIVAQYNSGYGNYIVISHGGGYSTLYAHNSVLCVKVGQSVTRGQVIAKCGSTGLSTGAHIHFEVQINGKTTNPMQYFR